MNDDTINGGATDGRPTDSGQESAALPPPYVHAGAPPPNRAPAAPQPRRPRHRRRRRRSRPHLRRRPGGLPRGVRRPDGHRRQRPRALRPAVAARARGGLRRLVDRRPLGARPLLVDLDRRAAGPGRRRGREPAHRARPGRPGAARGDRRGGAVPHAPRAATPALVAAGDVRTGRGSPCCPVLGSSAAERHAVPDPAVRRRSRTPPSRMPHSPTRRRPTPGSRTRAAPVPAGAGRCRSDAADAAEATTRTLRARRADPRRRGAHRRHDGRRPAGERHAHAVGDDDPRRDDPRPGARTARRHLRRSRALAGHPRGAPPAGHVGVRRGRPARRTARQPDLHPADRGRGPEHVRVGCRESSCSTSPRSRATPT